MPADHPPRPIRVRIAFGLVVHVGLDISVAPFNCRRPDMSALRKLVAITFDPRKRDKALAERGLDFDAAAVFAGRCFSVEDDRQDYGEVRIVTVGLLAGRMVVVGWVQRGDDRHVFSMRKGNDREQKTCSPLLA